MSRKEMLCCRQKKWLSEIIYHWPFPLPCAWILSVINLWQDFFFLMSLGAVCQPKCITNLLCAKRYQTIERERIRNGFWFQLTQRQAREPIELSCWYPVNQYSVKGNDGEILPSWLTEKIFLPGSDISYVSCDITKYMSRNILVPETWEKGVPAGE